jgi:hypothetical protein
MQEGDDCASEGMEALLLAVKNLNQKVEKFSAEEVARNWMAFNPMEAFQFLLEGNFDGFHFELEGLYGSWSQESPLALALVDHESGNVLYRRDFIQQSLNLINENDDRHRVNDDLMRAENAFEHASDRISAARNALIASRKIAGDSEK